MVMIDEVRDQFLDWTIFPMGDIAVSSIFDFNFFQNGRGAKTLFFACAFERAVAVTTEVQPMAMKYARCCGVFYGKFGQSVRVDHISTSVPTDRYHYQMLTKQALGHRV